MHGITLVRFFDVSVEPEFFWNYDQMSFLVEDTFDILMAKYLHFDFLLLLDQSSNHGKGRGKEH